MGLVFSAVIGNPVGLSGSVTFGIVSQLGRTVEYESTSSTFTIADIIQFSAPINPGNSGGPLLDTFGFVVGITSATASSGQGVGFAIPSDTILRELPYLISTGRYDKHPYVEIQAVDMNYQLAQASELGYEKFTRAIDVEFPGIRHLFSLLNQPQHIHLIRVVAHLKGRIRLLESFLDLQVCRSHMGPRDNLC